MSDITYLYVLRSLRNGRLYVGVTKSVDQRLERHNGREVIPTMKDVPYKVIYTEKFDSLTQARHREKFFKTGDGRRVLELKLKRV